MDGNRTSAFQVTDVDNLELTSGSFTDGIFWCTSAGTLTITKTEGGASTVATIPEGGAIHFDPWIAFSIVITSGTFHVG